MADIEAVELSPLHVAAINYAKRGIPVFPLIRKGTLPMVKWNVDATTNLDQINAWWTKNPEYNIGILTGEKSGIVVIDFLTPEAWETGQKMGVPVTPIAGAGKGYHVYCRYKEGSAHSLKGENFTGIIFIGDGGNVIAPPSIIERGAVYTWVDGKGFDDLELGDVPEWLLERSLEDSETISDQIPDGIENRAGGTDIHNVELQIPKNLQHIDITDIEVPENTQNEPYLSECDVLATVDSNLEAECETLPPMDSGWKAPILFEGVAVAEIKSELLPSWLGDYAFAVSQSTQTPEGMAVMLGLSVVAACVQKKFEVSPYGDEYCETLSLWTVTVLQSSERKSPVMNAMTAPLRAWEKEQAHLLKKEIIETATTIQIEQKRIEKLQLEASKAADSEARLKLSNDINEIQASMPVEVRAPKVWVGDITAETLQDMLAENGEKMALLSDEGNIFEIMTGLYSDNKVNIDIFLQAYSGCPARIVRKSRNVSLERPALTFGLAVQPVVIEGFASGSKKQLRGKGALGRFLFCIPESMLGKRIVGRRVPVPADVKDRYEAGISSLLSVPKALDEAGDEMPRILELDDDALETWEDFSRRVEIMIGPNGELSAMGDWGGKLPGTALRIAGLLHLVEFGPDRPIIGKKTLGRAIGLCEVLKGHAKAAFGLIGADEAVSGAKKVFRWMQSMDFEVFTKTECQRALKGSFDLDNALTGC